MNRNELENILCSWGTLWLHNWWEKCVQTLFKCITSPCNFNHDCKCINQCRRHSILTGNARTLYTGNGHVCTSILLKIKFGVSNRCTNSFTVLKIFPPQHPSQHPASLPHAKRSPPATLSSPRHNEHSEGEPTVH